MSLAISSIKLLKTSGWEYHIAVCVANSVPIGGNSPFAATAAMPMREEIALTKLLRMLSSSIPKTVINEVQNE